MTSQVYYINEKGKKVYLPDDVKIHFMKGNGGEFIVAANGQTYVSLKIEDTKNKITISPINEKNIEII